MKPNISMVQYSRSGGSSTRRWITASSRTYAVTAPGSVRIGSRGASWMSSGGESKGFKRPGNERSHERCSQIVGLVMPHKHGIAERLRETKKGEPSSAPLIDADL